VFGTGSSFQLARILGIRIGVNASWFIVLFLFIYLFQGSFEEKLASSDTTAFGVALGAAVLFFGSILLHELGHAFAARREGIEVAGIDLFLFGGVMKMSRDTDSPGAEFRVAAAGPAVTLLIIIVAGLVTMVMWGPDRLFDSTRLTGDQSEDIPIVLLSVLVGFNVLLLGFNLIPAFPLDGGRIARAIAWRVTGDRGRATRFSARIGQGFAVLLAGYGIYVVLGGDPWGLWSVMLGWLLGSAARGAILQSDFSDRLEGITVADLMDAEPVTIPADTPAVRAYEDFFLRYQGWEWFAVVDGDGRYAGIAHREPLRQVYEAGDNRPVGELVVPPGEEAQVRADTPLEVLLASEPLRRFGALMAVDGDGRLRGVVTLEQVSRALQAHAAAPGV
jgi:Zn-dependent protease/CBS domain-containing protein